MRSQESTSQDQMVHVQTVISLDLLHEVKKLANTPYTKEAIATAIEHFVSCPHVRIRSKLERDVTFGKTKALQLFHELLYALKESLEAIPDVKRNAFFEEYDKLNITPFNECDPSLHFKGVRLLLNGILHAIRDNDEMV